MAAFEYRADRKDLELDGRHWRELFGGATGSGPKMGAYIVCGPVAYVVFRILMALLSCGIFAWSLTFLMGVSAGGYWGIYFTNWVVAISAVYFNQKQRVQMESKYKVDVLPKPIDRLTFLDFMRKTQRQRKQLKQTEAYKQF